MKYPKLLGMAAALMCVLLTVGCPPLHLRLVYDQGGYTTDGTWGFDSFYSELHPVPGIGVTQIADDFILPVGTFPVTLSIRWWGRYDHHLEEVPTDDFTVRIYEQSCLGTMGSSCAGPLPEPLEEYHVGSVARVDTGEILQNVGDFVVPIYQYGCKIESFRLATGKRYFLCVLNDTGAWRWSRSDSSPQGNDSSYSRNPDEWPWRAENIDFAFQIRAMARP